MKEIIEATLQIGKMFFDMAIALLTFDSPILSIGTYITITYLLIKAIKRR